jgi:GNAT superfamily N-acetyltransferase
MNSHNIEGIERLAWIDAAAAGRRLNAPYQLSEERVGEALALRCAGVHNLMFNRVVGLGNGWRASGRQLDRLLKGYERRGIDAYFIHVSPGEAATQTRRMLRERGLVPYHRAWRKFVLRDPDPDPVETDFVIEPAQRTDSAAIAQIVADGFDFEPSIGRIFGALVDRPSWRIFVARDDGRVAAAGGLFVQGRVGYFAFAATDRQFRGRGAQKALIAARLDIARKLGCELVVTETGERLEGEPNISESNLVRSGFDPSYTRENWALPGVAWSAGGS